MIFSLWDDVEVNMLWLDSAYPLDRPTTDPGIKRGDCPGGTTSTPTYLRETYPNGGVVFKNAAVGEIGSTYVPPPPTPPTEPPIPTPKPTPSPIGGPQCDALGCCSSDFAACVTWCGTTKDACLTCGQDVGWICGEQQDCKARWNDCTNDPNGCCDGLTCVSINPGYSQCEKADVAPNPTPVPSRPPTSPPSLPLTTTPTPPPSLIPSTPPTAPPLSVPTKKPTSSPTLSPTVGCFSNNYKDCLPETYSNGAASCTTVWLPSGPQQGCTALWGDCTGQDDVNCCGDTVCSGDVNRAACVPPPGNPTKTPTSNPVTPNPTPLSCIICDDEETEWHHDNGVDCSTDHDRINEKCNKDDKWRANKYCRLSCYNAGQGYAGDVCCNDDIFNRKNLRGL